MSTATRLDRLDHFGSTVTIDGLAGAGRHCAERQGAFGFLRRVLIHQLRLPTLTDTNEAI